MTHGSKKEANLHSMDELSLLLSRVIARGLFPDLNWHLLFVSVIRLGMVNSVE